MNKEQLEKGKKLQSNLEEIEIIEKRILELKLGFINNGNYFYRFSSSIKLKEINEIEKEAIEITKVLLNSKIAELKNKIEQEFKNL